MFEWETAIKTEAIITDAEESWKYDVVPFSLRLIPNFNELRIRRVFSLFFFFEQEKLECDIEMNQAKRIANRMIIRFICYLCAI